ncbi:DUF4276 family protein [Amycolatopsis cihanbeyliensis]|uniref:Uncharacterized protein DUF4276 n=1 Tax=Amycolatopsis cihanbeyliensis TaxID=1128664 RepID=A0A542DLL0_AMYCI|nr:DUF4276 family protein [Amycolatopsis cihanbeyliensis]TQJ03976.1 uncharacterized protein DUF4276 [Amycolatopsis cihanbeyliensis]
MADRPRRLHVLVEGQTEEIVVNQVISPYLANYGWWTSHSLAKTKRPAGGSTHKGGVTRWAKLELDLRLLLRDSSIDVLTTVLDYYAFPADSPGMRTRPAGPPHDRVLHVEAALRTSVKDPRFLPNLVLHELETWVFAAAEELGSCGNDPKLAAILCRDVDAAGGSELVNDGPLAIAELGIDDLRTRCPHFDAWLTRLISAPAEML